MAGRRWPVLRLKAVSVTSERPAEISTAEKRLEPLSTIFAPDPLKCSPYLSAAHRVGPGQGYWLGAGFCFTRVRTRKLVQENDRVGYGLIAQLKFVTGLRLIAGHLAICLISL